ncbi:GNAT family N-acetyltransferase [Paenibacillus sp. N4]|uniref:GNAT family N-acetyltransferase n=1 Tax=Paenibacillus vietnamensis TaxID=2590547 RepID=UPI001CD08C1D|nr:GNAT family N-acetyltransferase [Paenibacillus vietnamensis]MCA0757450.1 GNAT family N-acetyltransferase [Paenibacillus vietnamensis]
MIEPASKEDVKEVLPLLLSAIGYIAFSLAGTDNEEEAARVLAEFYAREDNRLSYRHVLVYRKEGTVAGMLLSYPGDGAAELDAPLAARPGREGDTYAGSGITVEAEAGEYYLDAIAVEERYRKQGIAKALIAAFERRGRLEGYDTVSLIVEQDNKSAYSIYSKLGYVEYGFLDIRGCRYLRMKKRVDES